MSHICRIVQIAETSLRCVCERLGRVGDGFATYAMTWRRFYDDFCRTKSIKCDEFAMHARTLRYHANDLRQSATVLRIDSQTHRELVASQNDRGLLLTGSKIFCGCIFCASVVDWDYSSYQTN